MDMEYANAMLLERLAIFLNEQPDYITEQMVKSVASCGVSEEEAVRMLLGVVLDLDDEVMRSKYLALMVKELDKAKYENNSYYKNIRLDNISGNNWELKMMSYKPYELFVYNDLVLLDDGRVIPQIGYFKEEYTYPTLLQDEREWMLITPNEIETMEKAIDEAMGRVLTYGLGLGYFAYMVSNRESVMSVVVVEQDEEVIELFSQYILPQFKYRDKITIIRSDAYEYAKKKERYDFVFVDIWHDPSDGMDAYLRFKEMEMEGVVYRYWIEDTIKYYL